MAHQHRSNDNVVKRLPANASAEEKRQAEQNLAAARAAQALTPDQIRRRGETRRRKLTIPAKRSPGPSKKEWE